MDFITVVISDQSLDKTTHESFAPSFKLSAFSISQQQLNGKCF